MTSKPSDNPTPRPSDSPASPADGARSAGRGGLAVAFAKIYFIVAGLVQQVALPRVIGLDGYGALGTVLSLASITYNPITGTSIQGVSRAVAQAAPDAVAATLRKTLVLHAALGTLVAALFFVFAPLLATAIGAPHVASPLRVLSAVILIYGFYTPLVGALNGQKRFMAQAALDVTAATLRTVGLVVAAYVTVQASGERRAGVEGAAIGFVLSAAAVALVALVVVGAGRSGGGAPTLRSHAAFVLPLFAGQVLLNLLFQADLTLLRLFAGEAAERAGLDAMAADPFVGAYRASQLFCFLPYQLLISITFVLFPMLAGAVKAGARDDVRRYVETGLRLALVLAGAMVSVTSGLSEPLLALVFGREAAELGGRALSLLALGFGAFAIFGILTAVLTSLGRELASALVTLAAALFVAAACFAAVRGTELSSALLFKTAAATSAGIVLATLTAAWLVWKTAGGLVPPLTLVRVLLAIAVASTLGRVLPGSPVMLVVPWAALVATSYGAVLVVTRELSGGDLVLVRRVFSRSARRSPRA